MDVREINSMSFIIMSIYVLKVQIFIFDVWNNFGCRLKRTMQCN